MVADSLIVGFTFARSTVDELDSQHNVRSYLPSVSFRANGGYI
jgi:hypothetical protein